jgi:hypothetical protein
MHKLTLVPALLLASLSAGSALEAQKAAASSVAVGQTVRGTIASSDPRMDDGSHYDEWRLRGQPNQRVEIVMESTDFDAYLKITEAGGGEMIDSDDDGAGGTNARLVVTLAAKDYVISANTLQADETGSYTLRVTALPPAAPARAPMPLNGNSVTGVLNESDPLADDDTYYDDYRYVARARESVTIDLTSADFDAYLEIGRISDGKFESLKSNDDADDSGTNSRLQYTFPSAGEYVIRANTLTEGETGAYTLRLTGGGIRPAAAPVAARTIRAGETVTGALADTDPLADDDTYYDEYAYTGTAGERIVVDLASSDFDSYLILGKTTDGEFEALAQNDDNQDGGTGSTVVFTLPSAGTYLIRANSLGKSTGAYILSVKSLK